MRIIITGANGAFGGAMMRYFNKKGHEVIGCGRQSEAPGQLLHFGKYHELDLTKDFTVPDADVIIHAAAYSDDKADLRDLIEPNVAGTRLLADKSKHIPLFIYISSSSVYMPESFPITEDMAGNQNNAKLSPYGLSKLMGEDRLKEASEHDRCCILRARAFYGPGDTKIIPRMLKFVKNGHLQLPGKLENNLSMTHYENMGHAIECAIERAPTGLSVYNVADDRTYVMIQVLRKLMSGLYGHPLKEKGVSIYILKALAMFRIGGMTPLLIRAVTKDMVLDIQKIKGELGYDPSLDFDKALPELVRWVERIGGPEVLIDPPRDLCWRP